jgi:hypothetical protein
MSGIMNMTLENNKTLPKTNRYAAMRVLIKGVIHSHACENGFYREQ